MQFSNYIETDKLSPIQRFGMGFYNRFKTTLVLWAALVIFGGLCYGVLMKREGFPALNTPYSTVTGTYFVNDQTLVDSRIAKPIGDFILKQPRVKAVATSSGTNFYVIQIEYEEGVRAIDANKQIEAAVSKAALLPKAATASFKPVSFGVTYDGDNLLIAFYPIVRTDVEEIDKKADEAVAYLKGKDGISGAARVQKIELFRNGTDPTTGRPLKEQRSFDRVGLRVDGQTKFYPAAAIAVKAKAEVDELHLYDQTKAALERLRLNSRFNGYDAAVSANIAEGIRSQISSLQENLLGGLIAVIVVSFLLISLKASLATALSMTTVLAATLGVLYAIGYSLNTITLFSLILCLGLIVDDTTIMVEVIDAGRNLRHSRRQIVANATRKVARASATGTFTTMLAFAPLLFVGGIIGDIVFGIPVTIIISLAVSLLVSLSLVPFLAHFLLRGKHKNISPLGGLERWLSSRIAKMIGIGRHSRRKLSVLGLSAIALSLVLLVAGGFYFQKVKFNIFPSTKDTDGLVIQLEFPLGTSIAQAERSTDRASQLIASALGNNLRESSLYGQGSNTSTVLYVSLISYKQRAVKSPQLVKLTENALKEFHDANVKVGQSDVGPPVGTFGARIYSNDQSRAQRLAEDINAYLKGLALKRPDGSVAHIKTSQIANQEAIVRENGKKYVEVQATFDDTDTTALVTIAKNEVKKQFPPARIRSYGLPASALNFDFGSESDNQESFKAMLIAFPILLLAMYVLLAIQFRSLLQPLLIFLAIPFSLFGIAAGLYYTNNPFSFFTMIGLFALIGISVNNTILLTDYANQGRKAGLGRIDAMANAVRERFRPLVTTSLTSMVALTPLALSDPFWESLAVTLIFGLLSSTLLVIIAFPYYYLAAEWLRMRFRWQLGLLWLVGLATIVVVLGRSYQEYLLLGTAAYLLTTVVWLTGNRTVQRRQNS